LALESTAAAMKLHAPRRRSNGSAQQALASGLRSGAARRDLLGEVAVEIGEALEIASG